MEVLARLGWTLGVAAALALVPCSAHAGVYTFYSCKTPTGAAASVSDWAVAESYSNSGSLSNACPTGPLTLAMTPNVVHQPNSTIRITLRAPRDTSIFGYRLYRSTKVGSRYNFWRKEIVGSLWSPVETCHSTSSPACLTLGDPASPLSSKNLVQSSSRSDLAGLDLQLTCGEDDTKTTSCVSVSAPATLQLHRADVTMFDGYAPTFAVPPSGTLVDSPTELTGVQHAFVSAADRGGGVGRVKIEVDGQIVSDTVLDTNGGRCQEPYTTVQPCKTSASGWVSLDTASLPDGPHWLRLIVTDATGTNVGEWGPVRIHTANDACNPSPRVEGVRISAGVAAEKGKRGKAPAARRAIRIAYERHATMRGRLADPSGKGIAAASVCIVARANRTNASLARYGTVTTDAKGRFRFRLPRGPSRQVYAVYRVPGGAAAASVRLDVPAAVKLRASRTRLANGQRVRLQGKLRHGPYPSGPVLVEMQAQRGRSWQTFGTTSARRGRFRFTYRFTRTSGVQLYRLRARVARQAVYPFAAGASRPVTLRVWG